MVQLQQQVQSSGLFGPLQVHILFWFMWVQQRKGQEGWVKVNKEGVVVNK